jgi:hypothetical protein
LWTYKDYQDKNSQEQLQLLATEDQLQPFDLTKEILLRVTLVQLKSESSALLLTMHHIISDGWSMGVLLKELSSLYQVFLLDDGSVLPKLPIQYADFTIWQRQWLQGETQGFITIQNQINYWKQQLARSPSFARITYGQTPSLCANFPRWMFFLSVRGKTDSIPKRTQPQISNYSIYDVDGGLCYSIIPL